MPSVSSLQAVSLSVRYLENCEPSAKFQQRMFNWRCPRYATELKLNSVRAYAPENTNILRQPSASYFCDHYRKKSGERAALESELILPKEKCKINVSHTNFRFEEQFNYKCTILSRIFKFSVLETKGSRRNTILHIFDLFFHTELHPIWL